MGRYHDQLEREQQRSRDYYAGHREQKLAKLAEYNAAHRAELAVAARRYYAANRAAILNRQRGRKRNPATERIRYMKRHGGIDEWARLWEAQGGCCYLCGRTLEDVPQKMIAVDHDHDCCEGVKTTESCSACRRGLAHAWCNQLIGLAGEDMNVLRAIIANFERVNPETKARIAAKPRTAVLGTDAQGAVDEAYTPPMPDLDMPVGTAWPQGTDALF